MRTMKKILFLLGITCVGLPAISQTSVYHPFPDSNASWNFSWNIYMCFNGGFAEENYSIVLSGDTVIGSQTYHRLMIPYVEYNSTGGCSQYHFPGYRGAVREDSLESKVYFVPPSDTAEQLLYDFTMEVGDTVKGYLSTFLPGPDTVVQIDSVRVGQSYRKSWLVNSCYNITFIEGIGSSYGLLEPSPGCATDLPVYSLNCFRQNGQTLFPDTNSECQLIDVVPPAGRISAPVCVFPNPSSGGFTVDVRNCTNAEAVRITNLTGQTVYQKTIDGKERMNIPGLPAGTYVLTVTCIDQMQTNIKIVSLK